MDADSVLQYRTADGEPLVEVHLYDGKTLGLGDQKLWVASVADTGQVGQSGEHAPATVHGATDRTTQNGP